MAIAWIRDTAAWLYHGMHVPNCARQGANNCRRRTADAIARVQPHIQQVTHQLQRGVRYVDRAVRTRIDDVLMPIDKRIDVIRAGPQRDYIIREVLIFLHRIVSSPRFNSDELIENAIDEVSEMALNILDNYKIIENIDFLALISCDLTRGEITRVLNGTGLPKWAIKATDKYLQGINLFVGDNLLQRICAKLVYLYICMLYYLSLGKIDVYGFIKSKFIQLGTEAIRDHAQKFLRPLIESDFSSSITDPINDFLGKMHTNELTFNREDAIGVINALTRMLGQFVDGDLRLAVDNARPKINELTQKLTQLGFNTQADLIRGQLHLFLSSLTIGRLNLTADDKEKLRVIQDSLQALLDSAILPLLALRDQNEALGEALADPFAEAVRLQQRERLESPIKAAEEEFKKQLSNLQISINLFFSQFNRENSGLISVIDHALSSTAEKVVLKYDSSASDENRDAVARAMLRGTMGSSLAVAGGFLLSGVILPILGAASFIGAGVGAGYVHQNGIPGSGAISNIYDRVTDPRSYLMPLASAAQEEERLINGIISTVDRILTDLERRRKLSDIGQILGVRHNPKEHFLTMVRKIVGRHPSHRADVKLSQFAPIISEALLSLSRGVNAVMTPALAQARTNFQAIRF